MSGRARWHNADSCDVLVKTKLPSMFDLCVQMKWIVKQLTTSIDVRGTWTVQLVGRNIGSVG